MIDEASFIVNIIMININNYYILLNIGLLVLSSNSMFTKYGKFK